MIPPMVTNFTNQISGAELPRFWLLGAVGSSRRPRTEVGRFCTCDAPRLGATESGKVGATMAKDASQKHVLVVNDTPEILDLFQLLLSDEGFKVTVDRFTVEMAEMHSRVRNMKPDVIVLDYLIGREESGWQFLQMLKMDRQTRDIPIVICTGAAHQVQQIRSHLDEMGVEVVLKPFDIDHLLEVIGNALDMSTE
jgi:CheY-like chemotaxis protein